MYDTIQSQKFYCTLANDLYSDTNAPENHGYSKCGPTEAPEGDIYTFEQPVQSDEGGANPYETPKSLSTNK